MKHVLIDAQLLQAAITLIANATHQNVPFAQVNGVLNALSQSQDAAVPGDGS